MTISHTINHGKARWRANIQWRHYRRRLFFASREEAECFAQATRGPVKFKPSLSGGWFKPAYRP